MLKFSRLSRLLYGARAFSEEAKPPETTNFIESTLPSKAKKEILVTRPEKGALWAQGQVVLRYQRVKFRSDKFPSLKRIQRFLEYEQATDIDVIDIRKYTNNTPFTTVMICTGYSPRHISRIAYSLVRALREANVPDCQYFRVSGVRDSGWLMVLLKDVYLHVFTEETRKEMDLPGVYGYKMTDEEVEMFRMQGFEMYQKNRRRR
ncbi:unnamed protein product [Blepharisma stoltei]|uniref:Uncharacterized protein n=1 Tax=Blepharisma stoltei TaxID=1481888 RepID=A0AAU9J5T8_9CILI|nr:unnamed protein product [Blepharisma stoltei]